VYVEAIVYDVTLPAWLIPPALGSQGQEKGFGGLPLHEFSWSIPSGAPRAELVVIAAGLLGKNASKLVIRLTADRHVHPEEWQPALDHVARGGWWSDVARLSWDDVAYRSVA
jgi:hypothetical protein